MLMQITQGDIHTIWHLVAEIRYWDGEKKHKETGWKELLVLMVTTDHDTSLSWEKLNPAHLQPESTQILHALLCVYSTRWVVWG